MLRILIAIMFPAGLFAQNELAGFYNSCGSGRSINLTFAHHLYKNSNLGAGVLVNLRRNGMHDNNNFVYYKRMHPEKWYEYLGVDLFYERRIGLKNIKIPVYFMTDIQLKYSKTNDRAYVPYLDLEINPYWLLVESRATFGPFLWNQYSFGVVFEIPLIDKLSISQKLGAGGEFIFGKDPYLFGNNRDFVFEFAYLYNIGLKYQLNK